VKNRYTEQETVKKIYVGTNAVLKAHVTTGYSIREINKQVANGAVIEEDGTIVLKDGKVLSGEEQDKDGEHGNWMSKMLSVFKIVGILFGIWVVYRIVITAIRRRRLGV